jgi:hypothetical protein
VTPADVSELVTLLVGAFPNTKFTDENSAVYEAALRDLDRDVLAAAVNKLIATARFLPTPGEVRDMAVRVQVGERRPGGLAWGDVQNAMKKQSAYKTPGVDFVFRDPLVQTCVDALGWRELCMSTNSTADRARFIELYDQVTITSKEIAKLSPGARPRQLESRMLSQAVFEIVATLPQPLEDDG